MPARVWGAKSVGVRTRACVLVCLCIAFCSRDRASPRRERKAGRVMRVMRARIRSMCPPSCMRQRRRECICVSVCARISEFECMSMHAYTCVCTHTRTRKQRERCTAAYTCYMLIICTHTKQGGIANVAFRPLTRICRYTYKHIFTHIYTYIYIRCVHIHINMDKYKHTPARKTHKYNVYVYSYTYTHTYIHI